LQNHRKRIFRKTGISAGKNKKNRAAAKEKKIMTNSGKIRRLLFVITCMIALPFILVKVGNRNASTDVPAAAAKIVASDSVMHFLDYADSILNENLQIIRQIKIND
jgi:hypothetical protein